MLANRLVEELYLLKCSLLPGEYLHFNDLASRDAVTWERYLTEYPDGQLLGETPPASPPCFHVTANDARLSLAIQYPRLSTSGPPTVTVKGDDITRQEQEKWQRLIQQHMGELQDSEYPTYELITRLLPLLHSEASKQRDGPAGIDMNLPPTIEAISRPYHALLTSHHLISPSKRKNLQQWSSQLTVTGFAKVGYPGVIYCEGAQEQVEEFVTSIKSMQWLALRVRFLESLPNGSSPQANEKRRWVEFEKVGEVVEEMRRLDRETFVVEMGIGSTG